MAEQLNFSDFILQVIGSSNLVKVGIVHFLVTQDWFVGHDSIIVMFFGIWSVNVWNSGLGVGPVEALIDRSAQQVRPTIWISWLNSSADNPS